TIPPMTSMVASNTPIFGTERSFTMALAGPLPIQQGQYSIDLLLRIVDVRSKSNHTAATNGVRYVVFVQPSRNRFGVLRHERHYSRSAARIARRHERQGWYRRHPFDESASQRMDPRRHCVEADLVQQLQARVHPDHVLIWNRRDFEPAGIVLVCEIVLKHV